MAGMRYNPSNSAKCFLIAFGAGSLLFAVAVELFGEAINDINETDDWTGKGDALLMALFAMIGSFGIRWINRRLNHPEGFRKSIDRFLLKVSLAQSALKNMLICRCIRTNYQDLDQASAQPPISSIVPVKSIIIQQEPHLKSLTNRNKKTAGDLSDHDHSSGRAKHPQSQITIADGFSPKASPPVLQHVSTYDADRAPYQASEGTKSFAETIYYDPEALSPRELPPNTPSHTEMDVYSTERGETDSSLEGDSDEDDNIYQPRVVDNHGKSNVGLAIWVGLFVEGIIESLIIGVMSQDKDQGISISFILGVFLSNFPEAMSSAGLMLEEGHSTSTILLLWWSLLFLMGVISGLSAMLIPSDLPGAWSAIMHSVEGLAGGAMITLISQTMIPESFELGGDIAGPSTMFGFLVSMVLFVVFDAGKH
eukprot:TRINITY_DN9253_c0_g1_i1.p1 TRINITY_DN9253_c0_g1~~TRINITY_DN9253_c0_g1_i1.p1  ORF type:complete len:463 (+),score=77.56 TRINITY_DN9253_c0_g1_i1:122-1390(+)